MRHAALFFLLSTLGVLSGLVVSVIGVPYTRVDDRVFAELYHGTEDTVGTIHMAVDCAPGTAPTDSSCTYLWFDEFDELVVTVGNSTQSAVGLGAIGFTVRTDQTLLLPETTVDASPYLNANPDFIEASFDAGWACGPPQPESDANVSPLVADSKIACYMDFSTAMLQPGASHLPVAQVRYDVVAPLQIGDFTATIELIEGSVYDETFSELATCRPVIAVAGPCFDADVTQIRHTLPTPTYTPTPTATPVPDGDSDGVPDASDNCPAAANPAQENTDRNLISNAPVFAQMDTTRAKSDGDGDACDNDDDNDGVDDLVEQLHCPYGMWATNPLAFDTDGDRVHDGAECQFLTDATSALSKPTLAQCGTAADSDLDGLSDRIERCFYATSDLTADSDGDGVKDGCEAASFNGDTIVNVADLGMLASEVSRVPPPARLVNLDVNKDGVHNVADLGMVAARVGKCP